MNRPTCFSDCVLYHDYRSRDFLDKSGNGADGTPTGIKWNRDGLSFITTASKILVSHSSEQTSTAYTAIIYADFTRQSTYLAPIAKRDAGGVAGITFDLMLTAGTVRLYDGVASRSFSTTVKGHRCIGLDFAHGETGKVYKDGEFAGNLVGTSTIIPHDNDIWIGNDYLGGRNIEDNYKAVLLFTRRLEATEHAEVVAYLDSLTFDTKTDEVVMPNLAIDPDEADLNAGFDCEIKGIGGLQHIVDKSAEGMDMVQYGNGFINAQDNFGHAVESFNTSNIRWSRTTSANLSDFTLSAWVKARLGVWMGWARFNNMYAEIGTSGQLRYYSTNVSPSNAYSDGNIVDNAPNHIALIHSNDEMKYYINGQLDCTKTAVGSINSALKYLMNSYATSRNMDGKLYQLKHFFVDKGDDWIAKEYEKGRVAGWNGAYGVNISETATTSGFLENSPCTVESGSFKFSSEVINGEDVKVIECAIAGNLQVEVSELSQNKNEACYGNWKFWWKMLSGNGMAMKIAGDSTASGNEYSMIHRKTGNSCDLRVGSTNIITGGVISTDTWHKAEITRDYNNLWELKVDGISLGTGTNSTYKTSKYMVFNMDMGDKIAWSSKSGKYNLTKKLLA